MRRPRWAWAMQLLRRSWGGLWRAWRRERLPEPAHDGPDDPGGIPADWLARVRAANAPWVGANGGRRESTPLSTMGTPPRERTGMAPQLPADLHWHAQPPAVAHSPEWSSAPSATGSAARPAPPAARPDPEPPDTEPPDPEPNRRPSLRFSVGPSPRWVEAVPGPSPAGLPPTLTPRPPVLAVFTRRPAALIPAHSAASEVPAEWAPVSTPRLEGTHQSFPPTPPERRAFSTDLVSSSDLPQSHTGTWPASVGAWPEPRDLPEGSGARWPETALRQDAPPFHAFERTVMSSEPRLSSEAGFRTSQLQRPVELYGPEDDESSGWTDLPVAPESGRQDGMLDLVQQVKRQAEHDRALSREQRGEPWNG